MTNDMAVYVDCPQCGGMVVVHVDSDKKRVCAWHRVTGCVSCEPKMTAEGQFVEAFL